MSGEVEAEIQYEITSYPSTATTAISWYFVPATRLTIDSVRCHFSTAPTTADVFQICSIPAAGYTYGATIYNVTPSTGGNGTTKDVFWQPTRPFLLQSGDGIKILFTNTDAVTYGIRIVAVDNQPS